MQIQTQSLRPSSPIRQGQHAVSDPQPPEDRFQTSTHPVLAQAARDGVCGAFEGAGFAYAACIGNAYGPVAGGVVRAALIGVGALEGVKEYSARLEGQVGPKYNRIAAAMLGASKMALVTSLGGSFAHQMIGGSVLGSLFEIAEMPGAPGRR